jgi:DNA topoisomerase VI subunit A
VERYTFPRWRCNKILVIEKKGLVPVLLQAALGERFDMTIVGSEGCATEAARTLLEKAERQERYQIFVLHDADPTAT